MNVLPVHEEILKYVRKRGLERKFQRKLEAFGQNPFHPGLATELLEPREMRIWSFRIDRK